MLEKITESMMKHQIVLNVEWESLHPKVLNIAMGVKLASG